jgi:hypothetical protein
VTVWLVVILLMNVSDVSTRKRVLIEARSKLVALRAESPK